MKNISPDENNHLSENSKNIFFDEKDKEITIGKLYLAFFFFVVFGLLLAIGPTIFILIFPTFSKFQWLKNIIEEIGGALLAAAIITIITKIFVVKHYKKFEGDLQNYLKDKVNRSLENLENLVDKRINTHPSTVRGIRQAFAP